MKLRGKSKGIYCLFNIIFGILTIVGMIFYLKRGNIQLLLEEYRITYFILILLVAFSVHIIKALRLYVILFERKFNKLKYVQQYAKTAIVNLFLPFKSGEIYRGLCFGNMIGSYAQGYIIVVFDRFVDTLALITIVICCGLFVGFEITPVYIILLIFLLCMIVIYGMFIPLYRYWNHFLIFNKKSQHTLSGLQFLSTCYKAFLQINQVVRGRFVLLYLLSLIAWGIEIGSICIATHGVNKVRISTYLTGILTGELNDSSLIYSIVCLVLFIIVEIIVSILMDTKEKQNEKNCCL